MTTLIEYEEGTYWDTKSEVVIASVDGSFLVDTTKEITVKGYSFDNTTVAILYTNRETPEIREIATPVAVNPFEVTYEFTPTKSGELNLLLSNGVSRSEPWKIFCRDLSKVSSGLNEEGWLMLDDPDKLIVGTTERIDRTLVDVRHFKNAVPVIKKTGIHISKKGYLSFPTLSWDKTKESRTTSFIWYNAGNQQPYFCLAGEPFNYARNDYNDVEVGCRIYRNRGIYSAVGRLRNGGNCYAFDRYQYPESKRFYRFDIGNNGDRGQEFKLYLLESGDSKHWNEGVLVGRQDIPLPPVREGKTMTPMLANFNGSNNPLLAVRSI